MQTCKEGNTNTHSSIIYFQNPKRRTPLQRNALLVFVEDSDDASALERSRISENIKILRIYYEVFYVKNTFERFNMVSIYLT